MRKTKEQWLKYVKGKGGETSQQLMDADIPVPEAVVEKFLHRGEMMILAGPPKAGKSVIATQLAIATVQGGKFLGEFQAHRGSVIWYDVDDGDRHRAQVRLEDLGHEVKDEDIVYFRKLNLITDGGAAQIDSDLAMAAANGQNVAMVMIDCLMAILGSGTVKNVVQDQRQQLEALRALAVKYKVGLVIIHHSPKNAKKRGHGASIWDGMLGTTGIGTVVDVGVLLEGTGRAGEMLARFEGRNPDTPAELTLKLDRIGRTGWHVIEGADQDREGSEPSGVKKAIIEVLVDAKARLTPAEIGAAAQNSGTTLNFSSVRGTCRRMVQERLLTEHEGGRYGLPETAVTPVTAPASDCGTDTYDGYSYSYTGSEAQPRSATVTAGATLAMVPSRGAGTAVSSMPSLATVPPAAPPPVPTQKQPPAEAAAKAKPVATVPQTAQEIAPAVDVPKAPTAAKKDKWIHRAMNGLGGSASTMAVADYLKVTGLSRVGEITAHMDAMCDRRVLVRENSRTGTVYSNAC